MACKIALERMTEEQKQVLIPAEATLAVLELLFLFSDEADKEFHFSEQGNRQFKDIEQHDIREGFRKPGNTGRLFEYLDSLKSQGAL